MIPRKRYDTNSEASKYYAYRKAWDLLLFGYSYNDFIANDLTETEKREVWELAAKDIA